MREKVTLSDPFYFSAFLHMQSPDSECINITLMLCNVKTLADIISGLF